MFLCGYRYRLYPTVEQAEELTRWCGCGRAIYNAALEQRIVAYREYGVALGYNQQGRGLGELKAEVPWLAEPHTDVLQQALRDLDTAFRNFFEGRARFPRFHRRSNGDSFRIQHRERGRILVRRLNRRWGEVRVPKLGWIRFRWSRKPLGDIKHLTVTRDTLGWHVSLCCVAEESSFAHSGPAVGIDRGITASVTLSNGEEFHVPRTAIMKRQRLLRLERKRERQRKGSQRRACTVKAIANLRAAEARARKDFLHKLSTDIAKNHGVVVIEKLTVGNMTRRGRGKRGLNREILVQGWGQLREMLAYKTTQFGGELVEVPAAYTSQRCNACGTVDAASRQIKSFACVACGHQDDADVNAAKNILAAGLAVTARGALGVVNPGREARTNRELSHV